MGLFDKKNCAICGKEMGLFGSLKVEDGVICKECYRKLSPFFTGRKKTTVREIKAQLDYREKNKGALRPFSPDIILGEKTKFYQESGSGKFIVSTYTNWRDHNPDLISRSMVEACDVEIKEHKDEIYTENEAGERVSYDPPQYKFTYEFIIHIHVDSPYFDEIKYELTDGLNRPVGKDSAEYREAVILGRKIQAAVLPDKYTFAEGEDEVVFSVDIDPKTSESWKCECGHVNTEGRFCSKCGKPKPERWFCPDCGKENYGQFCVACGRKKPV